MEFMYGFVRTNLAGAKLFNTDSDRDDGVRQGERQAVDKIKEPPKMARAFLA